MRITLLILLALMLSSCAASLIYDPTLQLPSRSLEPSEVQAAAGAALLLETRPDTLGRVGVIGPTKLLRGAFSDRVTIGVKHWFVFSNYPRQSQSEQEFTFYRGGLLSTCRLKCP